MLAEAIERIRKPLEYSAKHNFANVERVRDLEKTVAAWFEVVTAAALAPSQHALLRQFRALFEQYDSKPAPQKIATIQAALRVLAQLERPTPEVPPAEVPPCPPLPEKITPVHAPTPLTPTPRPDFLPDLPPAAVSELTQPMQYLKGIGPKRLRLLNKLGIHTIEQALFFFPRRYEDRRRIEKIAHLRPGDALRTIYGTVKTSGVTITPKQKTKIFEVILGDETGLLTAKWFNQGFLKKVFEPHLRVVLSGKITMNRYGALEMIQPEYEILDEADTEGELLHTGRIVPIYALTEGLSQKEMRRIMKAIVDEYAGAVPECLPESLRQKYQFLPIHDALRRIHFPDAAEQFDLVQKEQAPAHQRLIFDEFFLLELGMGLKRQHLVTQNVGVAFHFDGVLERYLRAALPFSLTSAQDRVMQEIQRDMRAPRVMNRLLQGDVGSGKTLVALIALLSGIEAGYQGAIMVPTEILAEQHFRKIAEYLQSLNARVAEAHAWQRPTPSAQPVQADLYGTDTPPPITSCLLVGGLRKKERDDLLVKIQRGEIHLVVGTHALLQHDVIFHNLGIVVIDEQHKFGVIQRATLKAKGFQPDVLIMTATPIPRTLSLTIYGDLDVSLIDELPPGRTPIITRRFSDQQRDKAYRLIEQEIQHGRQVYIVYPLVEESEKLDLKAATEMSEHLAADIFPQYRVGLIHGRLKAEDKERQMLAFKEHALDILVSTTVLEVGIDVPNATVMLIEHAERFGLSQLHQLRGRVGRGAKQSYCLLLTTYPMSAEARRRLDAMIETTDGFVIAERDLEIRGPGEFFGTKQAGLPDLHIANLLRDFSVLERAREEAFALIHTDPALEQPQHQHVKQALEQRWHKSLDLISIG